MATSKQEAQWVLRAQCGDREALELLLRAVQPQLRRYLQRLVGASSADDVLQEALILVSRKLRWLEAPEAFRPWAYRVASRVAFRHLKKEKRWSDQVRDEAVLDDLPAAESAVPPEPLPELLQSEALSPASRAVLVLHFQEEISLPEVAAILEIPLGTVKSRLAYGLAALRKKLSPTRSM
ncbi:MAG TPA: sigma-70 family RNA polymerase sigma factor [Candidatus Baltobacteraceae bacterium]|nr:sigma-70 family RNA polymerase sigma factor [Candidatus Baltobacteraceae bacterium]